MMKRKLSIVVTLFLVVATGATFFMWPLLALAARPMNAGGPWWNSDWQFRVPVEVQAAGYARLDRPVEAALNFTQLLSSLGQSGALDQNSLRVIEVNASGQVVDEAVPFQFDPDPDFEASTKASGTVVFLMQGTTAATATRYFDIYFDVTGGAFTPLAVTPQVTVTDNIIDEEQASFQIETASGIYYYHKQGAGFSSLVDGDGHDWINYHPGGGSAGNYRGIPNLVPPPEGGYFHPGETTATSSLISQGPLKATIRSITNDNVWELLWEFYPRYTRMTVLSISETYWFLYEGTPGGGESLTSGDFVMRSDGTQTAASSSWAGDISGEEWVYFGDSDVGRSLMVVNHQNDTAPDTYYPLDGNMTVFGFGREDNSTSSFMTAHDPAYFTIGLIDETGLAAATQEIHSAYKALTVVVGQAEEQPDTPNQAPVAGFTAAPLSGTAPLTVALDAASSYDADGAIVSYAWSLGDGAVGTTVALSHTYAGAGVYTVVLTVTDNLAATDMTSATVTVNPAPPPGDSNSVWLPLIVKSF